jgi:hypothetical protein
MSLARVLLVDDNDVLHDRSRRKTLQVRRCRLFNIGRFTNQIFVASFVPALSRWHQTRHASEYCR